MHSLVVVVIVILAESSIVIKCFCFHISALKGSMQEVIWSDYGPVKALLLEKPETINRARPFYYSIQVRSR